jgi:hypothetical protein
VTERYVLHPEIVSAEADRDRANRITRLTLRAKRELMELEQTLEQLYLMGAKDAGMQPLHAAATAALLDIDALQGSIEAIERRADAYLDHLTAVNARQETDA